MAEKKPSDWATKEADRLLADPWGHPVADDTRDSIAKALDAARAEGGQRALRDAADELSGDKSGSIVTRPLVVWWLRKLADDLTRP